MPTSNSRTIAIEIDDETRDRVKRLADSRQRTPSGMMKEAIHQYLDREEKREAFRGDTLNAWKEVETTGMQVDADEVIAWLETWGDENELPAPKCRK
jgi:predicted transcriptional regulator